MTPSRFSGRALTVRNPWPFAIRFLGKDIENRVKPAPDRLVGPDAPWIALHTGKHVAGVDDLNDVLRMADWAGWTIEARGGILSARRGNDSALIASSKSPEVSPLSLIPGVFRITRQDAPGRGSSSGWRVFDQWGYRIDYRPLPTPLVCAGPTPKPGKRGSSNLGWWHTPVEVSKRIDSMIANVIEM